MLSSYAYILFLYCINLLWIRNSIYSHKNHCLCNPHWINLWIQYNKINDKLHYHLHTNNGRKHKERNCFISPIHIFVFQILLCQELFHQWTVYPSRVEHLLWLAPVSSEHSPIAFWWIHLSTGRPKGGIIYVVMFIIVIVWQILLFHFRFAMRDFRKENDLRYV